MPCLYFSMEKVCENLSRKGRCKKRTYPDGTHPFCGHDKTLLKLRKDLKKPKLNWRKFK